MTNVADYLARAAQRYGARYAYEDQEGAITFQELKNRAEILGSVINRLVDTQGPVAVFLPKSVAMISSFFGVVCCGRSYCPLDTDMPEERLGLILDTLRPCAVLTDRKLQGKIRKRGFGQSVILYEDALEAQADIQALAARRMMILDTDPLYIIFTSGSTGRPKGVVLPHRAVIDYMEWMTGRFIVTPEDVLGNQAEFFFDLSVQDVYAPIVCGCKTVILPRRLFLSPEELMTALNERKITILVWAPSALCAVANLNGMERIFPKYLRLVMFCGEVMPCRQLNYWTSRVPGVAWVNLYGPTETAVACTYYVVDRAYEDGESLPIGIPCENTGILVLDEENRPVRGGERGELCVRGSSLALGYYRNLGKTQEAFVQNPCNSDYPELIYRTGDLVYYRADGNLIYVSRKDFQIKHLGYRIELGEIETIAGLQEGVRECACIYDREKKRILLYYTGACWENVKLKEALAEKLPHYMIPNRVCHLEAMPYNRNGKIDRSRLKEKNSNMEERKG